MKASNSLLIAIRVLLITFGLSPFIQSCKKPKLGNYELSLYLNTGGGAQVFNGEEYKVNMKHIYYKNGIDGTLSKNNNKVEGTISLRNVATTTTFTVLLKGTIVKESYKIHRITGTYESSSTNSPNGNFEIIEAK